jgi:hypothetical protein
MRTAMMAIIATTTRWSEPVPAAPRFDSYLMVDWSAANTPRRGRDSIWLCLLQRQRDRLKETALENPLTRDNAYSRLLDILLKVIKEKRSILVGFDFPLGFSRGSWLSRVRLGEPSGTTLPSCCPTTSTTGTTGSSWPPS